MPCRPKHGLKCRPCHTTHRAEILDTTQLSCWYRTGRTQNMLCHAGMTQNISCRNVLLVMPNDRAAVCPKIAQPKSQLYLYCLGCLVFLGQGGNLVLRFGSSAFEKIRFLKNRNQSVTRNFRNRVCRFSITSFQFWF